MTVATQAVGLVVYLGLAALAYWLEGGAALKAYFFGGFAFFVVEAITGRRHAR